MKQVLCPVLFLCLFISFGFCQTKDSLNPRQQNNVIAFYCEPFINYRDDICLNGHINAEFDTMFKFLPKISLGSVSYFENENIKYVSSNIIPFSIYAAVGLITWDEIKNDPKGIKRGVNEYRWSDILGIPLLLATFGEIAHVIPNIKMNYHVTGNLNIYFGQNTDYFLFYHPSRICTQFIFGLKYNYKKFSTAAEIQFPWTKGYYKDKKPYINFGLGYKIFSL